MEILIAVALAVAAAVLEDPGEGSVPAAPPPILREEHFLLELSSDARGLALGGTSQGAREVGLAVWRRRVEADVRQDEWEIRFHEDGVEDTRVLHVERFERGRTKLVWRSWRPGEGRTLIVEWNDAGDALRVLEWGRSETLRVEIPAEGGAVMPLYLEGLARAGHVGGGRFVRFDPLSRCLERVRVDCLVDATAARDEGPRERLIELRREDDSLASAWLFDADGLQGFQWQAGGVRGRRIDADEYQRRMDRIVGGTESP